MTGSAPPFCFEIRSTNGLRAAQIAELGVATPVHEWTSWLRVRSDITGFVSPLGDPDDDDFTGFVPPVFEEDGLAVLVVTRPQQDFEGRAIGLFHARLDPDELERLRDAVESVHWASLPRPSGGDFTAPDLAIRHERGSLLIERRFNARSGNILEAIDPLMTVIDECMTRARKGPTATLELAVAAEIDTNDPSSRTLRITLRNGGIGGIVLTDPRVPVEPGRTPRLEVRVGELTSPRDDVDPLKWTTLPLPPLPESAARSLILGAKRRLVLELPWSAPKPGRYVVRIQWTDYEGPSEPAAGQIPFMPLPERGPSYLGAGPYPIRGSNLAALYIDVGDDAAR